MVEGGMKFIKYSIFCFNLLFFISGIVIIAVGAVAQAQFLQYESFLEDKFFSPPVLLIVVGCFIALIAFFGCCGAIKENHCMTMTFAVLLAIILILELSAGIAAYVLRGDLNTYVNSGMKSQINYYNQSDAHLAVTHNWNEIQQDLKCCGVDSPIDWRNASLWRNQSHGEQDVPDTCCKKVTTDCGINNMNNGNVTFTQGCYPQLKVEIEGNILAVGGVGIGLAFLQLIGVVFACCLARAIRYEYETV
jgi:CD63 antigen